MTSDAPRHEPHAPAPAGDDGAAEGIPEPLRLAVDQTVQGLVSM